MSDASKSPADVAKRFQPVDMSASINKIEPADGQNLPVLAEGETDKVLAEPIQVRVGGCHAIGWIVALERREATKGVKRGDVKGCGQTLYKVRNESQKPEDLNTGTFFSDELRVVAAPVAPAPIAEEVIEPPDVPDGPYVPPKPEASKVDLDEVKASENAKLLATKHGIDLNTVVGSGRDGVITVVDVRKRVAILAKAAEKAN